jgi:hypothetical protein
MTLSHLLFVDDVLLLCFIDEYNLRRNMELLDIFFAGTGMEVSFNKYACYCHNISRALFTGLKTLFPFETYDMDEGFKYHG